MTAQVVRLRDNLPVNRMVDEIHKHFATAIDSSKRATRARISAGVLLNALKTRIEAGEEGEGVNWWKWYDDHFVRSRRDAMRVMNMAKSEDPEAAHAIERAATRENVRKHREATYVSHQSEIVIKALQLVEQMTGKQRQQFFAELRSLYAYQHKDG